MKYRINEHTKRIDKNKQKQINQNRMKSVSVSVICREKYILYFKSHSI